MSRLGVVVNPTAGHGRGEPGGREVLAMLARGAHEITDLSGADAKDALAKARAALPGIDALVVVGGDGMAHLGVNAVAGTRTPLGIIPMGSGNDMARALGLPIHDVPAALGVLNEALSGEPRLIDAIASTPYVPGNRTRATSSPAAAEETEGPSAVETEWTSCVLSAGFDAAVNVRANAYSWPRGGGRYIRGVLAELATFAPYGYRLTIDGVLREQRGTLVALANAPSFGGGMRIAPDARVDDGFMDVVIADAVSALALLRIFPKVYSGKHVDHPAVQVVRAREVIIEPWAPHPLPPRVFGDGEEIGSTPIRNVLHPGALRLLTPTAP